MKALYPVNLERQPDGSILVSFPDVPEALTEGENEAAALREAQDALIAALGGYIEARRPLPRPSKPARGQALVALPPLVAAKLGLYQTMREAGMTNSELARRLGVTEAVVRRLLDLDHRSHIGQVEEALAVLGKRLVVEIQAA
ncbi:MAG: hypothetical protein WC383_04085 [Gammaproteobacteria bacterium]